MSERTPAVDRIPDGWTLAASAFNWTPDVIRGDRTSDDIVSGIVASGVAPVIELEPGQLWRSFPAPTDADVDRTRDALDDVGGSVSIVGVSLDDWGPDGGRRADAERFEFLRPQLRAAARVGALGVRLPAGQAGRPLLRTLLPELQELGLVLFEEIQGPQTPDDPATSAAIETIAGVNDPHIRILVDISMLMPALPVTYVELLAAAGLPGAFVDRVSTEWKDPRTTAAVVEMLRSGAVPPGVHTAYMNMLIRFGRTDAAALRGILPLIGAFHLKFWDLDDADGRVSCPIQDLGGVLAEAGFAGTLCSEWGGHEWIEDESADDMTRRHLALSRQALAVGAASIAKKEKA